MRRYSVSTRQRGEKAPVYLESPDTAYGVGRHSCSRLMMDERAIVNHVPTVRLSHLLEERPYLPPDEEPSDHVMSEVRARDIGRRYWSCCCH